MPADARRAEILAATADIVEAQGFLPAPVEQIARAAGVSKALIYAYFSDQHALYNALLLSLATPIAGRIGALRHRRLGPLAAAAARIYFEAVASRGVVLHTLMTDPYLDGRRDPAALALRDAVFRRLIRASRSGLRLSLRERSAALAIVLSVIEETGRLARRGEMEPARARELCAQLVQSALTGLRALPPGASG